MEQEHASPAAATAPSNRERLRRNVGRTLTLGFFQVFLVIMPVAVPFFQSKGLTMQDVFVLQAVFAFLVLITEVPSGYVADLIGRKRCLVVGAVFAGIGHSALVFADGFWGLVAFEAGLALAHSLISGADLALLYDTELALGRSDDEQRQVVGKLYSIRTLSETIAAVVCSGLLLWSMDLAVYVQAVIGWVPLAVALTLVEPPGQRLVGGDHVAEMVRICRHILGNGAILRLCFLALCIWSLTTFYAVWLLQKLWELQGIELHHFGYLWAALSLIAAISGRFAHVAEDRLGAPLLLAFVGLAPVAGYLGLMAFGPLGGLLASTLFFVSRSFGLVALRNAFNQRISSEFRSTANSLTSFGFRAGFAVSAASVGHALDLWGMGTALGILAVFSLVVFGALILPLIVAVRRQGTIPESGVAVGNESRE